MIAIPTDFDPATFASYDQTFRTHIESTHLGGRPLKGSGRIEPADVDRWKAALATTPAAHTGRPLAPSTRRRCRTVLRKGLGHAFRQGYIDQNVAAKDFVDGVKVPKRPIRPLSRPQMLRLLARAREEGDPDYAMYVLAFATGMRQGELLGLRWAYDELEPGLNLERGTVRVLMQQQRGKLDPAPQAR